jgi:predicted transcriptional regulator
MKKIVIGIASQDAIRARARAIARGEHRPAPGEPHIWFTSMRSLAEVLSDDNRLLLRTIREQKPESLQRLAELTGRAPSNLSRTLKTMARYGLVEMRKDQRRVRPVVTVSEFQIRAAA